MTQSKNYTAAFKARSAKEGWRQLNRMVHDDDREAIQAYIDRKNKARRKS